MLYVRFEPVEDPRGEGAPARRMMTGKVRVEEEWRDLNEFLKYHRLVRVQLNSPDAEGVVTGGIEVRDEDDPATSRIVPNLGI